MNYYQRLKLEQPEKFQDLLARRRERYRIPEVNDRVRKKMQEYRQRPEVKERYRKYQKAYRQRPEFKEKMREYQKEYQKIYRLKTRNRDFDVSDTSEPLVRCHCFKLVPESKKCPDRGCCTQVVQQ